MRKFLFLPHCLRESDVCTALITSSGYECAHCGACKIHTIMSYANDHDFKVYIAPGGSLVKQIFMHEQISDQDVVLGVACDAELQDLRKNFIKSKFNSGKKVPVRLLKDGCINTDVDVEELLRLMNSF